jgi:PKD repeat protein
LYAINASSQATYISSYYASNGDTVYLTSAQSGNNNFDTTGAGITWNYAALSGVSQQRLIFRVPTVTGFTVVQWPYIYNSNNVDLSSTNQQTIVAGTVKETNPNDYFLKNTGLIEQKASSFNIAADSVSLNIKNVYSSPDVLYKFPLNYTDTFSSAGAYTTAVPGVYYSNVKISRANTADGWGTVITPAGTFTHCLKITSLVTQVDTIAVAGNGIPSITTQYKELKWMDTSKGYPVLDVKEIKAGNIYVTSSIQYLDTQRFFQPVAQFVYYPLTPAVGDTVSFQNLSVNSNSYSWSFDDDSVSVLQNPFHVFTNAGTYNVRLIAYNRLLSDTVTEPVKVEGALPVNLVVFTAIKNNTSNLLQWTTAQEINSSYFEIQRSKDAINFSAIAQINAAGNSTAATDYSFADNKPANGENYYRLRIVNKDGSYVYSAIKSINDAVIFSAKIYPDPVKSLLTLNLNNDAAGNLQMQITDVNGKIIFSNQIFIPEGLSAQTINTTSLSNGIYYVKCKTVYGEMRLKFIKAD